MQSLAATATAGHRCKLCHRRFANGRALAGHMRSHVPPTPPRRPLPCPSVSSSSPSTAKAATTMQEEEASAKYALRSDRRKSFLHGHQEFSSSSAMQDPESDAESSLHRLTKRRRLPEESAAADELQSSVSDASSEEEVARYLVLLSRTAWSRSEPEECESDRRYEVEGDEHEEGDGKEHGMRSRSRRQSRFQCCTCRKLFRSYQALGGHRASHKRVGVECVPITIGNRICAGDSSDATVGHQTPKIWECPYCYRVFGSGQALGGHKRSHIYAAPAATTSTSPALPLPRPPSPAIPNGSCINLNLPAQLGDEAELSALSVATEYELTSFSSHHCQVQTKISSSEAIRGKSQCEEHQG